MNAIQASSMVSRSVMLGASALYLNDTKTESLGNENMSITWEIDNARVAGALGISGALYTAGMAWTLRKMVLQTRAQFVSEMAGRIIELTKMLTNGKYTTSAGGSIITYERRGLNQIKALILIMDRMANDASTAEDLIQLGIKGVELGEAISELRITFNEFDDTMALLQYANRLGTHPSSQVAVQLTGVEGITIGGRAIEDLASVISPAEQARLYKIAESQKTWQRQFPTRGGVERVGVMKFNPIANKDLALAARMFIPDPNAIDNMFNIAGDMQDIKVKMGVLDDGLVSSKLLIDNWNKTWLKPNILESGGVFNTMKSVAATTFHTVWEKTKDSVQVVNTIDEVVKTKMLPQVATAEKASDTWLIRGAGYITEKSVYGIAKKVGVKGATATKVSQGAAKGVKIVGRGLGRVLWVDTAIWVATGMYDLAFVEDEEGTYLGEHWGFSPVGFLIDEAVDYFLSEGEQEAVADSVSSMVVRAAGMDSMQELVYTVVDYFADIGVKFAPYDMLLEMSFESPASIMQIIPKDFNPLLILEAGIYLIVAKLVITKWIVPLWGSVVSHT